MKYRVKCKVIVEGWLEAEADDVFGAVEDVRRRYMEGTRLLDALMAGDFDMHKGMLRAVPFEKP